MMTRRAYLLLFGHEAAGIAGCDRRLGLIRVDGRTRRLGRDRRHDFLRKGVRDALGSGEECLSRLPFLCARGLGSVASRRAAEGRRTLSRILWKSRTLSDGTRHASHSRYHFFSRTGFPSSERKVSARRCWSGSRSPSSASALFVSTSVRNPGVDVCSAGETEATRLFASRSVRRRRMSGKFPRTVTELSVKSMASCWSCSTYAIRSCGSGG
jgi:hypothetical protein